MTAENIIIITLSVIIVLLLIFVATRKKRSDSVENEMSGTDFESYCAELLAQNGYKIEQMTAITGDFGADIIISRDNVRIAVQCKRYSKPVGVKAVQEAVSARDYYKCKKAAVITNSSFTRQAVTLAGETDVILWDGNFIAGLDTKEQSLEAPPDEISQIVFAPIISQEAVECELIIDKKVYCDGEFAEPLVLTMENGIHVAILKIGHRRTRLEFSVIDEGRRVFAIGKDEKKPLILEIGI